MTSRRLMILASMLCLASHAAETSKGETLFSEDFTGLTIPAGWQGTATSFALPAKGEGPAGGDCLKFMVAPGKELGEDGLLTLNLAPEKYKGRAILVETKIKGEGIKPLGRYDSVKLLIRYKTPDLAFVSGAKRAIGSFEWMDYSYFARIPDNIKELQLRIGLQGCSGALWLDKLRIVEIPRPSASAKNLGGKPQRSPILRGMMSGKHLEDADLKTFGQDWNANLIRLQVYAGKDICTPEKVDAWLKSLFTSLEPIISRCRKYGVKLVLDLHAAPGMTQNKLSQIDVAWEKSSQDELVRVWQKLAERYKDEPVVWAYDLLNEPNERDYKGENLDWNRLAERMAKAIREIDPEKPIIIEPAPYGKPAGFATFVPVDVPNVIYSVHVYEPFGFTHQGLYDGLPIGIAYPNKEMNKKALEKELAPVIQFQRKYNVPIYVGEFSVVRWAPGDSGVNWLRDAIDIFEANGWDWTYHAFREADCWDAEMGPDRDDKRRLTSSPRLDLLRKYFDRNLRQRDAVECAPRAGLPNFLAKCGKGGAVKVAYLGGSITAQAGWRVQSLDLLRRLYPQTKFEEVYAAIGGTDAEIGVFRLGHDVLAHKPDLLFVEFATNGGTKDAMEGIVRNTWTALPDCDICFVHTVAGDKSQALLEDGKLNADASVYEEIADHYAIPSIHMGLEAAKLAKAGKLAWRAPQAKVEQVAGKELDKHSSRQANSDGKIPFAADGVHPYLDTGHKLYTAALERSWPKLKAASGAPTPHAALPTPLTNYVKSVSFLDVRAAKLEGDWTQVEDPVKAFNSNSMALVPSAWMGKPGASLAFKFAGRQLLLYTLFGPGSGIVEISFDGKKSRLNCFDPYSVQWRLHPVFLTGKLDPKVAHTVSVKVLPDTLDKQAILAQAGNQKHLERNPDAFKPTDLALGGICIEDGTIVEPTGEADAQRRPESNGGTKVQSSLPSSPLGPSR